MVPPVLAARDRGVLKAEPMFHHLTPDGIAWNDGRTAPADVIIWCTGFEPDLRHLDPLQLTIDSGGVPRTDGTRAVDEPRLHLLGYGDWTGTGLGHPHRSRSHGQDMRRGGVESRGRRRLLT